MLAPAVSCVPFAPVGDVTLMALAEPLSVAMRALRRGAVGPGTSVGVVGCGTVGLLAVQAARAFGTGLVVAVEPHPPRRALAEHLGADAAVAPRDAAGVVAGLTDGVGLDVVIEVTGVAAGLQTAVALTRRGGATVVLGIFPAPVPVDLTDVVLGEKSLVASLSHTVDGDFTAAVELLARGQVRADALVTDRIALRDVVTDGLDALVAAPQDHLKILVVP
jgi:(R,R)-butanediol dehydrogenase/meso-butanediol dehydrogenase/diacetyl reductase